MDLLNILGNLINQFVNAAGNVVMAALVALIGWIVARVVARVVGNLLKKIGIDKLSERLNEIDIISNSNFEIVPSKVLSKMLYYVILIIFFMAATDVLAMPAVSQLMKDLVGYIPYLISALIVLVIGVLLADFLKKIVLTACQSLGIPSAKLIASFAFWFVFMTTAVSALSQAQIDTTFITSNLSVILAGVVLAFALGYGFASKEMMANFLASFYTKEKFKIGDVIQIEGIKGEIIEIDNSSFVLSAEGRRVIIPLSKLTTEKIEIFES